HNKSLFPPFFRVVVAKFPRGCVAVADMLALGKPFGTIVKHLIFPFKGFLEFSSHGEAKDMVNHYHTKPAFIKGHRISLCLSPSVEVIHRMKAQTVVCFSRLPVGKETEEEVLDIAAMFGDVRQSKFTEDRALIEMVDWRDADIMVKYYHTNPLRIQEKSIKVSLSSLSSLRSSRAKNESSSSSKSTSQSSSKDKSKSSTKEPLATEPRLEKEGEEGEKEKEEQKEEQKEEKEVKEGEEVEKTEEEQKDESGPADAEAAEGADVSMEEAELKEGRVGAEGAESKEEKQGEEERAPAEKEENKADKTPEEDMEDAQVLITAFYLFCCF
uniref:Si:ch211-271b14.1 n=1 Tax=Astyanax mexicanus TaxID=7994 RepID=A0A3B1JS46_ASTMX